MTPLKQYSQGCEAVRESFIEKYFVEDGINLEDVDYGWVLDEVGDVCMISDFFFSMSTMVIALRMDIPEDVLFAWYDYSLEDDGDINLYHFAKLHAPLPECVHGKHVSKYIRCNHCMNMSLCCDSPPEPAKKHCPEGETNYFICTNCKKPC
jgi:hypothetical protein